MEFLIGIFVGAFLYWVFTERKKTSGSFIVDFRDSSSEQPFVISMDDSLEEICMKKHIVLDVKVYEDDSLN